MPRLRSLVAVSDSYTSSSITNRRPANRDSAARMLANFSSAVEPGTRLVVAMAPALTSGFIVRSALSSMAITELKGRPVLLTPSLRRASSWPRVWQTRAKTKSLETLSMANSWSASPTEKRRPLHPGDTHAEGAGRRRGEGGNVIGDGPLVEMAIALVARGDDGLHVSVGRERPGRYSFGRSVVIPEGIVVHAHPLLASVPTSLQRPPVCPPVPSRLITPGSDVPGPKVHPAV